MHTLEVTVLKDEKPFLNGTFDVTEENYILVANMLGEIEMRRPQAASILSGYMHAREVGSVTEDMGKIALMATVFMLEQGETAIQIPL
ncbi:hypothetical protein [Kordiimonas pumila]|uniref:Uncharacterized protein n=1 Tax=Kordiimonas pumila TaxID=2161677 RepID=A0ABV7D1E8_9PROT|nr:hypothetical protein [Kordiimonas pumila]